MAYKSHTLHDAAGATADGTPMSLSGHRAFSIHYLDVDSPVGVLTFEGSTNGVTWHAVSLLNAAGAYVATATAPGVFHGPPHFALPLVRARISTYTSGALTALGSSRP